LEITPGGVITGRVTTAGGWPVIGQRIYPRLTDIPGQQKLPLVVDVSSLSKTDDRGVYRVYGLPTVRYIVSVEVEGRGPRTWTFHPGVTEESQAKAIEVTAGRVTENVDIKLPPIARAYEVRGRVVDETTGQPIPKIRVGRNTLSSDGKAATIDSGGASANENGEFDFTSLPPGQYSAYVPMDSGSEYYSDPIFFDVVDQDVAGVEVTARRAASLSGAIVVEGSRDPAVLADLSHLRVTAFRLAGGLGASAQAAPDGHFRIDGLPPDKIRLRLDTIPQRKNFSLLGVERDGVLQPESIEVAAGEQVNGLRVLVAYGEGVVQGQAQVVGGTLPVGARMSVYAGRADVPAGLLPPKS
jgi:hypothetical protein